MTSVNAWVATDEQHAPLLMGFLLHQVRTAFAAEDWGGLRQSHFRVLISVPPEGITITDLAERVGMTKQGCGQFVTQLVDSGHLAVESDPTDRRTRVVRRTASGWDMARKVTARNLRLEEQWADRVGVRRYQVFRGVLEQLAAEE
jgi:DNA-binding MarR family transcriptional regulator